MDAARVPLLSAEGAGLAAPVSTSTYTPQPLSAHCRLCRRCVGFGAVLRSHGAFCFVGVSPCCRGDVAHAPCRHPANPQRAAPRSMALTHFPALIPCVCARIVCLCFGVCVCAGAGPSTSSPHVGPAAGFLATGPGGVPLSPNSRMARAKYQRRHHHHHLLHGGGVGGGGGGGRAGAGAGSGSTGVGVGVGVGGGVGGVGGIGGVGGVGGGGRRAAAAAAARAVTRPPLLLHPRGLCVWVIPTALVLLAVALVTLAVLIAVPSVPVYRAHAEHFSWVLAVVLCVLAVLLPTALVFIAAWWARPGRRARQLQSFYDDSLLDQMLSGNVFEHYDVEGEASAAAGTVVVLAGASSPRNVSKIFTSELAKYLRTICIDLPSHGSLFAVAYSLSRCERVVSAVLAKEARHDRVLVVAQGASW